MSMSTTNKCRRTLALLTIALSVGVAAGWMRGQPDVAAAADSATPYVVSCELDGFRYEFHAPTGAECLFDAKRDSRGLVNLLVDHADVAAACRLELRRKYGEHYLGSLRARYAESVGRLKAMGYL